jgi:hypothetical protein
LSELLTNHKKGKSITTATAKSSNQINSRHHFSLSMRESINEPEDGWDETALFSVLIVCPF